MVFTMVTLPVRELRPEPLIREAFAPFGTVIETDGAQAIPINQGTTLRYNALAEADPGPDGRAILSIFVGTQRSNPIDIAMLERHPLGAQAFVPLSDRPWLIVVAEKPSVEHLRCFLASGDQGVSYKRGVWHHPLLVLEPNQAFLVVDRAGPGENLEEQELDGRATIKQS